MFTITQAKWRKFGFTCIAIAAVMAWFGVSDIQSSVQTTWQLVVYWGLFTLLLIGALYTVLLDVRYIRLQYALERQELYRNTLGSAEFRQQLRDAMSEKTTQTDENPPDSSPGKQ